MALIPRMTGGRARSFKTSFIFTSISAEPERNLSPDAKDVSAHYLVSLRPRGMKVTASNLTCRDGNLSDTLNNLLMQKLKGLFSLAARGEESRVLDNGADVQNAGFCPSAKGRRTTEEQRWRYWLFSLAFLWVNFYPKRWLKGDTL